VAVRTIVTRFPGLRLADGAEPEWLDNFNVRGLKELRVAV
jgi:cytochrome P450